MGTIPVKMRFNHSMYFKWILKKYPQAGKYIWEKTSSKINDIHLDFFGRKVVLKQLPKRLINYLLKKTGLKTKSSLDSKNHMNPYDYWYRTNNDLRRFLNGYFEKNIKLLGKDKELAKDCEDLYRNGTTLEKAQVLTLLSVIKLYFKDGLD